MFNTNITPADPRERLMTVGNQLLDVIYDLDVTAPLTRAMIAAKDDKDELTELMKSPGAMEAVLKNITDSLKRDGLVREYVTLRQTIEALTNPRPEVNS